jgi:hypothetical protein
MQPASAAALVAEAGAAAARAAGPLYQPASADHGTGGGDGDAGEELETVEASGFVAHSEDVLNRALSENGWSMRRVFELLTPEARDRLAERMPFAAPYVSCDPAMVAETRRRLRLTTDSDTDATALSRVRRTVEDIQPIGMSSADFATPWERRTDESAALASGYGRGVIDGADAGAVPEASVWIDAVKHMEPLLNRDEDAVHPYEMNARITAFLVQLMRARAVQTRFVHAADIDASEGIGGAAAAAAAATAAEW